MKNVKKKFFILDCFLRFSLSNSYCYIKRTLETRLIYQRCDVNVLTRQPNCKNFQFCVHYFYKKTSHKGYILSKVESLSGLNRILFLNTPTYTMNSICFSVSVYVWAYETGIMESIYMTFISNFCR